MAADRTTRVRSVELVVAEGQRVVRIGRDVGRLQLEIRVLDVICPDIVPERIRDDLRRTPEANRVADVRLVFHAQDNGDGGQIFSRASSRRA